MFALSLLFACSPDTKPNLGPATASDASTPPSLETLLQSYHDQVCDAVDSCLDPASGVDDANRTAYEGLWEELCASGAPPEFACEAPDRDALQDCVNSDWTCDAGGLNVPPRCLDVCPDPIEPEPVPEVCGQVVEWVGATDTVVFRPVFRFRFDEVDPLATVSLEADGVFYSVQTRWEDDVLVVEPGALPPGAEVNGTVISCGEEETFDFDVTVSRHGAPLVAPAGGAYTLSLAGGTFLEPAGLDGLVAEELERPLLLGIEDHQTTLDTALVESGATDDTVLCTGGVGYGMAAFDPQSPWLEVSYLEAFLPRSAQGESLLVHDLVLTGAFDEEATEIAGITLSGRADTRSLFDDDCASMLSPLGIDCVPCPDGAMPCVDLVITDLTAEYRWWVADVYADFLGTCD